MAKNNFNFQVKMGLDSGGFKRGVREVQGSLNSLRSSFLSVAGALGVGLGLQSLVTNLKNTAVELDTAMNTLKNVSKVTETFDTSVGQITTTVSNFGDNLEWLKGISNTYGQDLVVLTHSFAQFTAACKGTGLELEQQKYIYEQLTRAAANFHLSADSTKDMMVAVTQMMSKGKVTAEELRRQLGNSLPGAFNIMARACGVSTAKLDKMMKNGEVISSEVLPKFAAELEKTTEGASFDSLQLSINRLKNEWYEFTENTNVGGALKIGVDSVTKALSLMADNIKHIGILLISIGSTTAFSRLKSQGDLYIKSLIDEINTLELRLQGFGARFRNISEDVKTGEVGGKPYFTDATNVSQRELERLVKHNQSLITLYNNKKKLNGIKIFNKDELKILEDATDYLISLSKGADTTSKKITGLGAGITNAITSLWTTLKSIGKSTLITAAFFAVGELINKIISDLKEAKEQAQLFNNTIKEIYDNYTNNVNDAVTTAEQQVEQAKIYLSYLTDITKTESSRRLALKKIADIIGDIEIKEIDVTNINEASEAYKKLAKRISEWADVSVKAAQIEIYTQERARAEVEKKKKQQRIDEIDLSGGNLSEQKYTVIGYYQSNSLTGGIQPKYGYAQVDTELGKERKKHEAEIAGYDKIIEDAKTNVTALGGEMKEIVDELNKTINDEDVGLAKIYKDYLKKIDELAKQLKEGAVTQTDYDTKLKKLIESTFESAAATGELSIMSITQKKESGKLLSAMERWYMTIAEKANTSIMDAMYKEVGVMLEKLNDEVEKEMNSFFDNNESVKRMSESIQKYHEYLKLIPKTFTPQRNSLFDYSKTKSDIFGEQFDIATDRVNQIQEIIDKLNEAHLAGNNVTKELQQWSDELKIAQLHADSFEEAMNLAKIREDIEGLSKTLSDAIYGGFTGIVSSIDGIVSAFDRLNSTLSDIDASGWEKFMAVFSTFTSILDTAIGLYEMFNTLSTISNTLKGAEAAEQATINGLKAQELATAQALLATKGTEIGLSQTATVTKMGEAAASSVAASASAGEAVAGATASGAKMPFPLNLLAIAAGVAAVVAALASMSKFADGGIVGGNATHGDRNIARVNSGEMILNKAQQGTLWSMLNGKGGIGGRVNFKIKGSDLLGVMENEIRKRNG